MQFNEKHFLEFCNKNRSNLEAEATLVKLRSLINKSAHIIFTNVILSEKEIVLLSKALREVNSIKSITFCDVNLDSAVSGAIFENFIETIATLPVLESISLTRCGINDHEAQIISRKLGDRPLKHIELASNFISDKGALDLLKAFNGNNNLKSLDLNTNHISYDERFVDEVITFRINYTLHLSFSDEHFYIVDEKVESHVINLIKNTSISSLVITSRLTDLDFIHALSKAIQKNNFIKELKFIKMIDKVDYWLKEFQVILEKHLSLTTVCLDFGNFEKKYDEQEIKCEIRGLFHSVGLSETVENFTLSNIPIPSSVIKAAIPFIEKNKTLINLSLPNCELDDQAVKYICEAIKNNKVITSIDFSSNNITDEGAELIINAAENNYFLGNINISNNSVSFEGEKRLDKVLEKNNQTQKLFHMNLQYLVNLLETSNLHELDQLLKLRRELNKATRATFLSSEERAGYEKELYKLKISYYFILLGVTKDVYNPEKTGSAFSKLPHEVIHKIAELLIIKRKEHDSKGLGEDLRETIEADVWEDSEEEVCSEEEVDSKDELEVEESEELEKCEEGLSAQDYIAPVMPQLVLLPCMPNVGLSNNFISSSYYLIQNYSLLNYSYYAQYLTVIYSTVYLQLQQLPLGLAPSLPLPSLEDHGGEKRKVMEESDEPKEPIELDFKRRKVDEEGSEYLSEVDSAEEKPTTEQVSEDEDKTTAKSYVQRYANRGNNSSYWYK